MSQIKGFLKKFFLISFLIFSMITLSIAEEQSVDEFISQMKNALEQKNIPAYLDCFSSKIRKIEEELINTIFDVSEMDSVAVFKAYKKIETQDDATLFVKILFQNSYSVVIEAWGLALEKMDGRWQVKEKKVTGNINNLYRLKIPSERVERVRLIEIKHVDIKITFEDAIIFYDNIPAHETALLILGKGHLFFSPSSPLEKHQLELIYKENILQDRLKYAYLRFSDSFFKDNIKIIREDDKENLVTQADKNIAYSLFVKYYSRSFTVKNSLNGGLLSFLPKGNRALFEFEGRKIGELTYIFSPFAEEEINLYQWKKERVINLYTPSVDKNEKRLFISFGQKFDVSNYQIDIAFNPEKFYFSGKAKVEVESKIDSLSALKFKLNSNLEILRITDEDKNELFYTKDDFRKTLYIYFLHLPSRNKKASIEIYYRGKIEPPELTADVISLAQYDITYKRSRTDKSFLYSQSSYWYPVPPDEDYFTARVKIIVPPEYSVISSGKLIEQSELKGLEKVEEIEKTGFSVNVFETKKPVKYLSFIVGKFKKIKETSAPLPLEYFCTSNVDSKNNDIFEQAKDILEFYESRFGPYPFEKLSIVRRVWFSSGGHSPPSFIVLNELPRFPEEIRLIRRSSPVDLSHWKEYFLAHEIAHQWWGQGVAWDSYHDHWISEGLAQFSAVLYLREKYGERAFSNILKKFSRWIEKKSEWGPITMGSRISYFDFEAYQSIIYNKTSLVLNMLKDFLGEDLFFKGIKEFFMLNRYRAASTNDFYKTIIETSGRDLKPFFKNWFESYHLPEVKVSKTVEKRAEGFLLNLKITQQKELFVFPLWIEWMENGNKVKKKLIIDRKVKDFSFELRTKPDKIKVNPDHAVPGKFFK